MYTVRDFASLHHVSVIIWDIDGTITDPNGEVNHEVAAKIINLGLKGVYHVFITGRDSGWIVKNVIEPMKKFYGFSRVHDNLIFFAEVGCKLVTVDARGNVIQKVHPALENHPLRCNQFGIRDALKAVCYNPETLEKYEEGRQINPTEYEVIYDANKVGWLVSRSAPRPEFPYHIWSIYKEVFATLENIRDAEGRALYFRQDPWAEKLQKEVIDRLGLSNEIGIEIVSTALNIVPKINGVALGKSWAAGNALLHLWEEKLGKAFTLDEIINKAIAFGDGKADFDFTIPFFKQEIAEGLERKTIQLVFVGEEEDLPSDNELLKNVIISANGGGDLVFAKKKHVIELHPIKGAMVVSKVLDFLMLWDYFRSF